MTNRGDQKQKAHWRKVSGLLFYKVLGDDLLSHARCTLPLAQARFTSEFGMGSGGTKPLWSPSKGGGEES